MRQSFLCAAGARRSAASSPWLEKLMWMVAGCALVSSA
jgi:hypothetical protein